MDKNLQLECCKKINLINKFEYKKRPKQEKKFAIKQKYYRRIDLCKNCGHLFSRHNINLDNIYDDDYIKLTYKNLENLKKTFKKIITLPKNKSDNKKRLKRILNFLKKEKKNSMQMTFLDIGSGLGIFPWSIKNFCKKIYCTEVSQKNILFLKKYLSLETFKKNKIYQLKNKVDFVTINKVLEHISNPNYLLKKIYKILKKRSYLYIEVPSNLAVKKGKETQELFIEHHHIFSKQSLKNLLERNRFKIVKISNVIDPSNKYTIFAFVQKIK